MTCWKCRSPIGMMRSRHSSLIDLTNRVGVAVGRSGRRTNHANAEAHAFDTDPTRPIKSWKEGWKSAKLAADVRCRFHDLRHTCCTRMLEGGVPRRISRF